MSLSVRYMLSMERAVLNLSSLTVFFRRRSKSKKNSLTRILLLYTSDFIRVIRSSSLLSTKLVLSNAKIKVNENYCRKKEKKIRNRKKNMRLGRSRKSKGRRIYRWGDVRRGSTLKNVFCDCGSGHGNDFSETSSYNFMIKKPN